MSAGREAEQLLLTLLQALQRNDQPSPDCGIDHVFDLASERMRAAVGDLASFRRAFHNDRYAPLLEHRQHAVEALEQRGDRARATVSVAGADGVPVRYVVAMGRARQGDRTGAWLVHGMVREGVDL